ncbi:MAG: hypothetical protein HOV80_14045 [Polyangiaceae bacterium]|nr:hypothetical protein [Polyangiaceae bacterium]
MRRRHWGWVIGLAVIGCGDSDADDSGTGGSGGSAPASCVSDPWSCPDGQTCWVNSDQKSFACLNSGPGAVGTECSSIAASPACQDDLICLQLQGQAKGACTEYCDPMDPAHACPENRQCLAVQLAGSLLHACAPPAGEGGGGGGTGGGGGPGTGGAGGN